MALELTSSIVSKVDLSRMHRELLALDDYLLQASIRTPGTPMSLPKTSRTLDDMARLNKLNLLDEKTRVTLKNFLELVKDKAPEMHMSFAAEPTAVFVQKLIIWLRANIHQQALLSIGLQPTIAVGSIVRTPNHYFDFSLRKHLDESKVALAELIKKASLPQTQPAPSPQPVAPAEAA